MTKLNWLRINSDSNGNPRYVVHFLALVRDSDAPVNSKYDLAIRRAKKIGGKKFHNKQYGGGIVFQSYNLEETERAIFDLLAKEEAPK